MTGSVVGDAASTPALAPLLRTLARPPGWWLLGFVTAVWLILVNSLSLPGGGPFRLLMLTVPLALGTITVWTARLAAALARRDGRAGLRRHWARWAAAPVLGVSVIAMAYTDLPFSVRFALSEASLERYARTVASRPDSVRESRWVGLFPLQDAEAIEGGGARFLVRDSGFLDRFGFAWSPAGMPPDESHTGYERIGGAWYRWTSRF
ncbi:hypothetical protein FXF51_19695 [Nonomuraea sp. PA05]|uniref:hypothetical protein n=1 Tax=Nonomuraea sp. PA05 TaxID=2604466 RepID=UPI0011D33675|nr:hypothetical protein [Nonomuraea sp. PA05]TYB65433.1 hypothetical protein FXF51_19695 [Nonomuraea sp. PA05]